MLLLEEYDDNKVAVINPNDVIKKVDNMPDVAIACFSHILFNKIVSGGKCLKIAELHNTNSDKDVYEIEYNDPDQREREYRGSLRMMEELCGLIEHSS